MLEGKYLGNYSIMDDIHHRFNSVIQEGDHLLLTGLLDVDNNKKEKQDSFTMEFNIKDNQFSNKQVLSDKDDYIVNKLVNLDKKIIIGTSKSNCGIYGCEYEPIIKNY